MAGYKMETSHAGRNCQKLDNVSPALSIQNRVVSIRDRVVSMQPRMVLVDIVVAVAKLAVLGSGTALEAPWNMGQ